MADLIAWPERLPVPLSTGYGYQAQKPFVRTDMESGLARHRRRFARFPVTVSVVWLFTQEQLGLFEGFVHHELLDGVMWFAAVIASGQDTKRVKARMIDSPKVERVSPVGLWNVSVQLETLDMPVADADQYVFLRDFGQDVMHYTSSELHKLIHSDLPGPLTW